MQKTQNQRDDIHRLYVSRKEEGRGFTKIENYVNASVQGLVEYIKKSKERLITTASNSNGNIKSNRKQQKLENRNRKKNNFIDMSS